MDTVIQGDCLEVMKTLPDNSVDLIVADPPYFKVKKDWWDNQWDKPAEFLGWLDRIAEQWQRILKPNGSLYCFASPKMAARVEVMLGDRFEVLSNICWNKPENPGFDGWKGKTSKESLRQWYPYSERIIFCEHPGSDNMAKGEAGYGTKCDELHQNIFAPVFGAYFLSEFERAKVSKTEIASLFPSASGRLTGCVSNWILGNNQPSKEQYDRIGGYLNSLPNSSGDYFARPYEELHQQYEDLKVDYEELHQQYEYLKADYEDLRRPFAVSADVPYTDVWTFPTVQPYPGKHPCEKPLSLLSHIINASSRPGAVVLDCFAGSGATLVAAKHIDRRFIGIEIDPHWVNVAQQRLGQFERSLTLEERVQWLETQVKVNTKKIKAIEDKTNQLTLFSA